VSGFLRCEFPAISCEALVKPEVNFNVDLNRHRLPIQQFGCRAGHAAIGSASSSHGLGIVEGGSLAGKESANVLSRLFSRRQGLGLRRMAWRRTVSASSDEMVTTAVYTQKPCLGGTCSERRIK
jgi:hypothetical protein